MAIGWTRIHVLVGFDPPLLLFKWRQLIVGGHTNVAALVIEARLRVGSQMVAE